MSNPVSGVPSRTEQPDEESALIDRSRAGELAAFDQLVLRHQQEVFSVALRMLGNREEAEDIAQDAFVRAYQSLSSFRGDAKFSTWVISITINLCRNRRRWFARHRKLLRKWWDQETATSTPATPEPTTDPDQAADRLLEAQERNRSLQDALLSLDAPSREVVVLRDIEGHSYEEIASTLRCEVGTVKSRLHRARNRLGSLLRGRI